MIAQRRPLPPCANGADTAKWALAAMLLPLGIYELYRFLLLYLAPSMILTERVVLLLAAGSAVVAALRPRRRTVIQSRPWQLRPWVLGAIGLVAALLIGNRLGPASAWVGMVGFVALMIAMTALFRPDAQLRTVVLSGLALVAFVHLPRLVLEPVTLWLLDAVFSAAALLAQWLVPAASFSTGVVTVNGLRIAMLPPCAGVDYLMAVSAAALVAWAPLAPPLPRLIRELALALGIGFAANILRIITMLLLTEQGYVDLALGSGHLALGSAFMAGGALLVFLRIRRPGR